MARITRIEVGRLYNLGNYEHVRYAVTVDVPPDESAAAAFADVAALLNALNPNDAPHEEYQVLNAKELLGHPPAAPLGEEETYAAEKARAEKIVKEQKAWEEARKTALDRFDRIGGEMVKTDSKEDWEDNWDQED